MGRSTARNLRIRRQKQKIKKTLRKLGKQREKSRAK
jgi:hypothetical protein